MKRYLLLSLLISGAASAQQKIDVQAHRGGRALMPENTIPAMKHAIDLGVRTLELDCVISSDKKVVVSHDLYMSADFMRTPDGKDIDKKDERSYIIYKMPYDSVRKYDAGTKPHPEFPEQVKMKTYKPLLSELIDSVEAYVKANHLKPVYYNMETKTMPMGDGNYHPAPDEFTALLMEVINEKKIANRTMIQSFDVRTLQAIHTKYPKQQISLLVFSASLKSLIPAQDTAKLKGMLEDKGIVADVKRLGFKPDIYSPFYKAVTPEMVKEAHAQKMQIIPWTANQTEELEKLLSMGVDGIITDAPDKLVKLAGSYQKK
jgi:glycerophosphoryl diester phosphodiesterase